MRTKDEYPKVSDTYGDVIQDKSVECERAVTLLSITEGAQRREDNGRAPWV